MNDKQELYEALEVINEAILHEKLTCFEAGQLNRLNEVKASIESVIKANKN